jgi:D-alanine transaminase
MTRIVFINNEFLPIEKATIPVMDRGFLFADGVYDVAAVLNGKLVDNDAHIKRLQRSLNELKIPMPMEFSEIVKNELELVAKNNLQEGLVYIQVTRGTAEREFNYPENIKPNIVMFTQSKNITNNLNTKNGVKAITTPDIRWARRDIKSIALLAQVIAKNEAKDKGAFEAIMHEDGIVTEGSSSNIFIIKDGKIITRNLSNKILHGITRAAVLSLAKAANLEIEERAFTIEEIYNSDECFLTSATNFVLGIIDVDGKKISDGKVGKYTGNLFEIYLATAVAKS